MNQVIHHNENSGLKKKLKEILPTIIDLKLTSVVGGGDTMMPPEFDVSRTNTSNDDVSQMNLSKGMIGGSHFEERIYSTVDNISNITNNSMMNQLRSIGHNGNAKTVLSPPTTAHISNSTDHSSNGHIAVNRRGKHLKYNVGMLQKR